MRHEDINSNENHSNFLLWKNSLFPPHGSSTLSRCFGRTAVFKCFSLESFFIKNQWKCSTDSQEREENPLEYTEQLSHIFGWGWLKQDLAFFKTSSRLGPNCPSYYWQFFHLLLLMGEDVHLDSADTHCTHMRMLWAVDGRETGGRVCNIKRCVWEVCTVFRSVQNSCLLSFISF